jgi:hypothetical protein
MTDWGLMTETALNRIRHSFWANRPVFKALMKGEKPFPISLSLKPPGGKQAQDNLPHLQKYITSWQNFPHNQFVVFEPDALQGLSIAPLPMKLELPDIKSVATCLGEAELQELQQIQDKISYVLAQSFVPEFKREDLFFCLIDFLETLAAFNQSELTNLCLIIPQLSENLGQSHYLRALPVKQVDTKFIDDNQPFIEALLNVLYDNQVTSLTQWLNCKRNPKAWLMVRPLDKDTQKKLSGLPLLQIDTRTLLNYPLPAKHILVVESVQSGLGIPALPDTIVVFGGGKNVSWLAADWLNEKKVAYFGNIDTQGLAILADARAKLPNIQPLMMDRNTLACYQERMVATDCFDEIPSANFTTEEKALFDSLHKGVNGKNRLEQERLPPDYIKENLKSWLDMT